MGILKKIVSLSCNMNILRKSKHYNQLLCIISHKSEISNWKSGWCTSFEDIWIDRKLLFFYDCKVKQEMIGGYDYDFVSDIPGELVCVLCDLPLRNPVQLSACGHRLCQSCFDTLKNHCNKKLEHVFFFSERRHYCGTCMWNHSAFLGPALIWINAQTRGSN